MEVPLTEVRRADPVFRRQDCAFVLTLAENL
jgi:hypothetical protein